MPDEAAEALQKYDPDNISTNAVVFPFATRPGPSFRARSSTRGWWRRSPQPRRATKRGTWCVVGVFLLKERVGQS